MAEMQSPFALVHAAVCQTVTIVPGTQLYEVASPEQLGHNLTRLLTCLLKLTHLRLFVVR